MSSAVSRTMAAGIALGWATLAVACGGGGGGSAPDVGTDANIDVGVDVGLDMGLDTGADTGAVIPCEHLPGLYAPGSCTQLARSSIMSMTPRFVLWSDGASKERFMELPPGGQIDGADPNAWVFPVGTKFWKHFIADSRRVETRYLEKVGEVDTQTAQSCAAGSEQIPSANRMNGCWIMATYKWNQDATDVEPAPIVNGERNVLGTNHDIPAQADCVECHRARDTALGVSSIQLNHDNAGVPLAYLISTNTLRNLPVGFTAAQANIPGDATQVAALGYMHANCGHCHNGVGGVAAYNGFRLWVPVGITDVTQTPTYTTGVGVQTVWFYNNMTYARFSAGSAATSAVILRMSSRQPSVQMPRIGTEETDAVGIAAVADWINTL